jgi:hypothetical protein
LKKFSSTTFDNMSHPICWTRKETPTDEEGKNICDATCTCMAVNGLGDVYVGGHCGAGLFSEVAGGPMDNAFITQFDTDGGKANDGFDPFTHVMSWFTYTDSNGVTVHSLISNAVSVDCIVSSSLCAWGMGGDMKVPITGRSDSAIKVGSDDYGIVLGDTTSSMHPFTRITSLASGATGIYVCGTTTGSLYQSIDSTHTIEYFLAKYVGNSDVWHKQWSEDNFFYGYDRISMAIDPDENVYVLIYTDNETTGSGLLLIKFDSSGNQIWTNQFDIDLLENCEYSIVTDNAGNAYISSDSR